MYVWMFFLVNVVRLVMSWFMFVIIWVGEVFCCGVMLMCMIGVLWMLLVVIEENRILLCWFREFLSVLDMNVFCMVICFSGFCELVECSIVWECLLLIWVSVMMRRMIRNRIRMSVVMVI